MKLTATPDQIQAIEAALRQIHISPFSCESSNAKWNAQRNLSGRSHYYSDDTLKWHHSRICWSKLLANGLLHAALCTDALDMHNTRRGFRVIVHDVFGTCVSRADLQDAKASRKAAERAWEGIEFNLVQHYQTAFNEKLNADAAALSELETARNSVNAL